jgi:hypothetical protein
MVPIIPIVDLITSSNQRIKEIDQQRRSIDVTAGQTEPKVENMKLGRQKNLN